MNAYILLNAIEEELLSKVDWSGHWPDQIDGTQILGYRLGADYSCPDFESGRYIITVWDGKVPLFDVMANADGYKVRFIEDRE